MSNSTEKTDQWAFAVGSIVSGLTFYGPFDSPQEANNVLNWLVDYAGGVDTQPPILLETLTFYVNTYLIDKAYGGPEEGGWWYNTQDPVNQAGEVVEFIRYVESGMEILKPADLSEQTFTSLTDAEAFRAKMEARCKEWNADRRSDINSVLSEGKYVVRIELEPPLCDPTTKPHYE